MAEQYPSFSSESIEGALEAARRDHEGQDLKSLGMKGLPPSSELSVLAQCISVTVSNNKVCLNLPLGIGSVCLPIPISFPNGTVAQACLSICTTWGLPTGVKVSVIVAGITIVQQTFGKC
ncbi:hypothetical protein Sa4125_42360 [Aureimonas sp. SA4125]|uniref:hypothetical protein n=1 Tax=Aureimonas sp. SA4125 TaxID=2826993 RepID=UPI001CC6B5C9|nr:hypothetical protein [Aureimonas sp. SA4125]BDA86694.1 hypothetical protein Sa4125_42360 [Aureimonas sp. SA4125]